MFDRDDHRALGPRLDLFHFQDEAPGMVFWHPRGFVLLRLLEEAIRRRLARDGYREVRTPQLLRRPIWEASGHWQHFREGMFVLDGAEPESALKPVSCPGHLQLFAQAAPSYRDLPLRLAELGLCHRNEPSGSLHGLFRLRQFTQDDGHIFCAEEDVGDEIVRFVAGLRAFYGDLGFAHLEAALSTRPALRAGSDEGWDRAEAALEAAARAAGLAPVIQPGEGAFYGPKLELALHDRRGRAWQCGTIQLDFVLPERFAVAYVDRDGARRRPVMLHRALLGSLERFLGVLLEEYRGALPPWLAPAQLLIVPLTREAAAEAEALAAAARAAGLRAEVDAGGETLARKVVTAHERGVPWVAALGRRELGDGTVAVRERDGGQWSRPRAEALAELVARAAAPA
jgi:threonyl-tRNA synthetase